MKPVYKKVYYLADELWTHNYALFAWNEKVRDDSTNLDEALKNLSRTHDAIMEIYHKMIKISTELKKKEI